MRLCRGSSRTHVGDGVGQMYLVVVTTTVTCFLPTFPFDPPDEEPDEEPEPELEPLPG